MIKMIIKFNKLILQTYSKKYNSFKIKNKKKKLITQLNFI